MPRVIFDLNRNVWNAHDGCFHSGYFQVFSKILKLRKNISKIKNRQKNTETKIIRGKLKLKQTNRISAKNQKSHPCITEKLNKFCSIFSRLLTCTNKSGYCEMTVMICVSIWQVK